MKTLQKLILPVLIIAAVFLVYKFYFVKDDNLGSFSDFDPNNNAVKEIRVQVLDSQNISQQNGSFSFMVSDKNGKTLQSFGSVDLPKGIENSRIVILRGHVNQSGFCTHEVLLE